MRLLGYLTHDMTCVLLRQFDQRLTVAKTSPHFAHVNSAKCCMNKPQRRQADTVLFENCRQFVPGELAILRPDVIVSQGAPAREAVSAQCQLVRTYRRTVGETSCELSLVMLDRREVLWIPTHHPSAYGVFWPQKKACWDLYADAGSIRPTRDPRCMGG